EDRSQGGLGRPAVDDVEQVEVPLRSRIVGNLQPTKQAVAVLGRVSGLEHLGVTLDEVVEDGCGCAAGGGDASGKGSGHPPADVVAQVMVQTRPIPRVAFSCLVLGHAANTGPKV